MSLRCRDIYINPLIAEFRGKNLNKKRVNNLSCFFYYIKKDNNNKHEPYYLIYLPVGLRVKTTQIARATRFISKVFINSTSNQDQWARDDCIYEATPVRQESSLSTLLSSTRTFPG